MTAACPCGACGPYVVAGAPSLSEPRAIPHAGAWVAAATEAGGALVYFATLDDPESTGTWDHVPVDNPDDADHFPTADDALWIAEAECDAAAEDSD